MDASRRAAHPWSSLPLEARLFRLAHACYSVVGLSAFGGVWLGALRRRRDRYLFASVAFLLVEGVALVIGRGNCPLGSFQARLGDPVPFFELALPPRAAKAAVPVLAIGSIVGMVAALLRPPRAR